MADKENTSEKSESAAVQSKGPARPESRMRHLWRHHVRPILILVLVLTALRSIAADWNDVPTGSMRPTIVDGDRIYVNKLAYSLKVPYTTVHLAWWDQPKRGDIVVFYRPDTGVRLVKRVVGLPGDRISVRGDLLAINGEPLKYDRLGPEAGAALPADVRTGAEFFTEHLDAHPHTVMIMPLKHNNPAYRVNGEYTVPAGQYFMMGDNRDNSEDSRYFGPVPLHLIVGRSSATVFSLDYNDHYLPRGDRWFKGLP